tara:strand:+ start:1108 stop:2115 length:1008 start_codon:yes stop_codon:yes gene_type:complete
MSIGGEKALLLAVMRNEGPYIIEWIAHHFALGIDDLLVFSNFCTDNTDKILDRIEEIWPHRVKHQPNPKVMFPRQGKWLIMALRFAGHFGRYQSAPWVYTTDPDEFLNFTGDIETFDDFFARTGDADVVSFTSIAFNSGGHKHAKDELVSKMYTQTAADLETAAAENREVLTAVKTLYRNKVQGARRPHRPVTHDFSDQGFKWINGSGQTMPPEFTDSAYKAIASNGTRDYAQINHYSIKSAEEFILKVDRGDGGQNDRVGESARYWNTANRQGNIDTRGVGLSAAAHEIYDFLMTDAKLKALYEECLELRHNRFTEIVATESGQELGRITGYYD